jgi:TPR repeat protein
MEAIVCSKDVGVPQDFKEAIKWYRLSACQGYAEASDNLGRIRLSPKGFAAMYGKKLSKSVRNTKV